LSSPFAMRQSLSERTRVSGSVQLSLKMPAHTGAACGLRLCRRRVRLEAQTAPRRLCPARYSADAGKRQRRPPFSWSQLVIRLSKLRPERHIP
jgi:hypothetical protein